MDRTEIQRALDAAIAAQRGGQPAEAARRFHDIIARGGEQPVALNALGVQALAARDFATAAALFRRAIAVDTQAPDLWMNLAKAHRELGDDPGERAALDGALAIDQRHFMALVRMAELHERTGDPARAAERWAGVLAMAPAIEQRTPAIEAMFAHAHEAVAKQQADFARAVDAGLAEARSALEPSERRRFDACVDHLLGRREIYANVCSGLHMPFLPAEEFFERRHFPWLAAVEAETATIRAELTALLAADASAILPYVAMAPGTPANKWSPLDHKLDWGALHLWKNGVRDDAACARAPRTAALIEALPIARIPNRAPSIFFSLLQPGAHLPAHTGVSNLRTIIHLPLIVPEGCAFRVGGETRAWREGEAWAFDDTIEHEAWNRSERLRAILIFDVWNPYLSAAERGLLKAFFPVADRHGYDMRAEVGD